MSYERMFRVIVLGGVTLVGATGCGATVQGADGNTPDVGREEFPREGPALVDVPAVDAVDLFPHEGPMLLDVPVADQADAPTALDVFPHEGPVMLDVPLPEDATDAGAPAADAPADACFPRETALPWDC